MFGPLNLHRPMPEVPPPVRSVPAVTPVIVPSAVPGNVCPGAKVMAESGASDQTIMRIAGHVSKKMLSHYSHTSDWRRSGMRWTLWRLSRF
jgi:hypothetical protein